MWMDKQRAFLQGDEEKYEEEDVLLAKGTKNTLLGDRQFVLDAKNGLEYKNEKVIAAQRALLSYLAKAVGSNLVRGKSIMGISLPINIFEPRSFVQKCAADFCYAPIFIDRIRNEESNIEQFKHIVAFGIASLHADVQMRKPFNPILGETSQGRIGEYEIAIEQTCHHPPITHFQIWHPEDDSVKIEGYFEYCAKTSMNTFKGRKLGPLTVKCKEIEVTI